MSETELCFLTARELAHRIRTCEVSAKEVFNILQAWKFALEREYDLRRHRDLLKDTVI